MRARGQGVRQAASARWTEEQTGYVGQGEPTTNVRNFPGAPASGLGRTVEASRKDVDACGKDVRG